MCAECVDASCFVRRCAFHFTICRGEASGSRQNGDGGAAVKRADVVHVWVNVGVRRVKGRLRPHGGVPLGRDPDEGDVGESWTASQHRRPAGTDRENMDMYYKCVTNSHKVLTDHMKIHL